MVMGSVVCLFQARCISDVKADTDHTSFLTGTLSLKEENEVNGSFFRLHYYYPRYPDLKSCCDWLLRFICYVYHLVDLSWYARVCFRIPMRFGTLLLPLSINASSLLSSPLVVVKKN